MRLIAGSPPAALADAIAAEIGRRCAEGGDGGVPSAAAQASLAGWHRVFRPGPGEAAGTGPGGLAFAGWCCLLLAGERVECRIRVSDDASAPAVSALERGASVDDWVRMIVAIEALAERAAGVAAREPALLVVPDVLSSAVLLLPADGSAGEPVVVPLVLRARRQAACRVYGLAAFLNDARHWAELGRAGRAARGATVLDSG